MSDDVHTMPDPQRDKDGRFGDGSTSTPRSRRGGRPKPPAGASPSPSPADKAAEEALPEARPEDGDKKRKASAVAPAEAPPRFYLNVGGSAPSTGVPATPGVVMGVRGQGVTF